MSAARVIIYAATLSLVGPIGANEVRCWQDPVVTYTNGMRLPSTTSQRSHNVYWQCDPGHVGYCDGRMYGPCKNDLRAIGSRAGVGYRLPYGSTSPNVPVDRAQGYHSPDGMEYGSGERLGQIPVDEAGVTRLGLGALQAEPGATGSDSAEEPEWLNSLKSISEKVMQNSGDAQALGF